MKLLSERLAVTLVVLGIGVVVTVITGSILALGLTVIATIGAPKVVGRTQRIRAGK